MTHYSRLKISPSASQEEIRDAFLKWREGLSVFSPGIEWSDEEIKSRYPYEWQAYSILLDEERRKKYDSSVEIPVAEETFEKEPANDETRTGIFNAGAMKVGILLVLVLLSILLLKPDLYGNKASHAVWTKHKVNNDFTILIPAEADTNLTILPVYLQDYLQSRHCYKSELPDGFCVTVASLSAYPEYSIAFRDFDYLGDEYMQSHRTIMEREEKTEMNIHGYHVQLVKGKYRLEGGEYCFENYSLLKGDEAVKVIISYVPGNELHAQYADIVFKSLYQ